MACRLTRLAGGVHGYNPDPAVRRDDVTEATTAPGRLSLETTALRAFVGDGWAVLPGPPPGPAEAS